MFHLYCYKYETLTLLREINNRHLLVKGFRTQTSTQYKSLSKRKTIRWVFPLTNLFVAQQIYERFNRYLALIFSLS